jgi:hypothetical protein
LLAQRKAQACIVSKSLVNAGLFYVQDDRSIFRFRQLLLRCFNQLYPSNKAPFVYALGQIDISALPDSGMSWMHLGVTIRPML